MKSVTRGFVANANMSTQKFKMKISWVILTHNRSKTVNRAFKHNMLNAGLPDLRDHQVEIIWVDNGSRVPVEATYLNVMADVKIWNKFNLGVSKGYNRGLVLCTGDLIAITGCDRLMPKNWLSQAIRAHEAIPTTGIISYYSKPLDQVPERKRGCPNQMNGIEIQCAMPIEAKVFSRSLHSRIGYLKEDLGLYGWEDVLWGERAEKVTADMGLINYIFPEQIAQHLGDEGIAEWTQQDEQSYHEFKKLESQDPKKLEICQEYRRMGHPYVNPYI